MRVVDVRSVSAPSIPEIAQSHWLALQIERAVERTRLIDSTQVSMRPTVRLWQACRITLFTRPNCGLCDMAKTVLQRVQAETPFVFKEVNIVGGTADAKAWRDLYDFDVPVVSSRSKLSIPSPMLLSAGES